MYIGVENQSEINYAMVVKNLLYDALNYAAQVSKIAKTNKEECRLTASEFLSGFRKEDRLIQVITITMLWKGCDWDGARSLKELFYPGDGANQLLLNDYHLNLIIPNECDVNLLQSEFKLVMQVLQRSEDKERLFELFQTDSSFSDISNDLAKVICEFTNLKKPRAKKGGRINVCKAVEDWKRGIVEETTTKVKAETTLRVFQILSQVLSGIISVKDASIELGISESDISTLLQN